MAKAFPITSTSNPRIKRLLKLRKHRDRRHEGVFIAEGLREVDRAHAAGLVIEELYLCPAVLAGKRIEADATQRFEISEVILKKAAYRDDPEGVLAVVRQPTWSLAELPGEGLFLIAVGTEKPGNLGAMVRTAAAAGCAAVLATGPVDAFNPNAIRASTGAVFSLPVVEADDQVIIDHCRGRSIRLLAASPAPAGAIPYSQADFRGNTAIVIGPEDRGLDFALVGGGRPTRDHPHGIRDNYRDDFQDHFRGNCRHNFRERGVDSLNAAAAAAILLFEARKQRLAAATPPTP